MGVYMYVATPLCLYDNKALGLQFFDLLKKYDLELDRLGEYEPIRTPFELDKALQLWTEKREVYDDWLEQDQGYAGGFMGKSVKHGYWMDIAWWDFYYELEFNTKTSNSFSFGFQIQTYRKRKEDIEPLFKELIDLTNAYYGFISEEKAKYRQIEHNVVREALPGIFYCNFFGNELVNYLGEEKITIYPWHKWERIESGLYTYLAPSALDPRLRKEPLENPAKEYFGTEKFYIETNKDENYPKFEIQTNLKQPE